jgi:transcription elongation factor GreA
MRVPTRRSEQYSRPKLDPHITAEKYQELVNKLEHLKKVSRLKSMKEVATLAEMGDLSENAAYQIAKGRLRGINQLMLDLENQIKKAVIIQPRKNNSKVGLGSKVTVLTNDKEKTYLVLGSAEVDPTKNIISHNSPLGSALLGKKVGDTVFVELKKTQIKVLIVAIN